MNTTVYSIFSFRFWKAYRITMRPYLLFISGAAGMTGFVDGPPASTITNVGVFLVFFLSYGFGQALTDCFQMDTDSISSPYRPLIRGIIHRKQVLAISLTGLGLCCLFLGLLNPWTVIPGFLSVFGLATYTFFKRRWWAGPFYNAWIVALLPVMGKMAALGKGLSLNALTDCVPMLVVIGVFFSYANFVLTGYFKDVSADRASGYRTFVVVYGWGKAAFVSDVFAVFSIFATGWVLRNAWIHHLTGSFPWIWVLFFPTAASVLLLAQSGIHRVRHEGEAHRPIANVVRAFVLFRIAEIAVRRPDWVLPSLLYYGLFEWVLSRRPEKGQI